MKKWLLSTTIVTCVLASAPNAWAGDSLWRQHSSSTGTPAASTAVSDSTTGTPANTHYRGTQMSDGPDEHTPDIRSSVQLSRSVLREAYVASREAYTSKLQKYAKCTPAQAKKAVMDAHPGMKVEDVQLRNVRTNLVYMAIAEDDQDKFFVVVDAGNCKVLMDRPLPTRHERVFSGH